MIIIIEQGKCLLLENLISIRDDFFEHEVGVAIEKLEKVMSDYYVMKSGPMVTATYGFELVDDKQRLDMEIFIPINRKIKLAKPFFFQDNLEINNSLYIRHVGNPSKLVDSHMNLLAKIKEDNLTQMSPIYNVTINQVQTIDKIDEMIIDLYVQAV